MRSRRRARQQIGKKDDQEATETADHCAPVLSLGCLFSLLFCRLLQERASRFMKEVGQLFGFSHLCQSSAFSSFSEYFLFFTYVMHTPQPDCTYTSATTTTTTTHRHRLFSLCPPAFFSLSLSYQHNTRSRGNQETRFFFLDLVFDKRKARSWLLRRGRECFSSEGGGNLFPPVVLSSSGLNFQADFLPFRLLPRASSL